MRAVLCHRHGPPEDLVVEEVPSPSPAPGAVVVSVEAAGLNFPDTLVIQGRYQFQPPFPFSPGGEAAGVVKAVGDGVERVRPGDRVIAVPGMGCFREEIEVDARTIIPMPDEMDFATAAALPLTYATSHYALVDRAALQPGEWLLVLGAAGGVGLSAVEIGKALGARVIAAASSKEKLAVCADHGADALVDYSAEDLRARIKEITGGEGADVIYDPVGGDLAEPALRSIAWQGRFLVIGFAAGEIPRIPLNLALLKGCSIVGVFWGSFAMREPARNAANIGQLLDWWREGKIRPHVSATYPLEEVAPAMRSMMERKVTGKVVLVTR